MDERGIVAAVTRRRRWQWRGVGVEAEGNTAAVMRQRQGGSDEAATMANEGDDGDDDDDDDGGRWNGKTSWPTTTGGIVLPQPREGVRRPTLHGLRRRQTPTPNNSRQRIPSNW